MQVTEYVFIFVSFILALAVGEVVQGMGRILKPQSDFKVDALFLIWLFFLFVNMLSFWYASWSWQGIQSWSYIAMMGPISAVILLYLLANISFSIDPSIDGPSIYMRLSSRLWTLYFIFLIVAWLAWRVAGMLDFELRLKDVDHGIAIVISLVLARSKREWVHWTGLGYLLLYGAIESLLFPMLM